MISCDNELRVTQARIAHMQAQLAKLREVEADPATFHASASGFLAEMDRMQAEVREYLGLHPSEVHA